MRVEILTLLFLVAAVQCRPMTFEQIEKSSQDCMEQVNMNKNALDNAYRQQNLAPPSTKFYRFLECHYKNQNYLDDQGYVVYDNIKTFLMKIYEPQEAKNVVNSCKHLQVGSTAGERIYNSAKCLVDALKKLDEAGSESVEVNTNQL